MVSIIIILFLAIIGILVAYHHKQHPNTNDPNRSPVHAESKKDRRISVRPFFVLSHLSFGIFIVGMLIFGMETFGSSASPFSFAMIFRPPRLCHGVSGSPFSR